MPAIPLRERVLNEERRVCVSIPCLACRYDLRTLEETGRCPECGMAVRQTLDGWLPLAPKRWLRRVFAGGVIILSALLFMVVLAIVQAWFATPRFPTQIGVTVRPAPWEQYVGFFGVCVWPALGFLGLWVASAPVDGPQVVCRARVALRWSALVLAVTLVASYTPPFVRLLPPAVSGALAIFLTVTGFSVALSGLRYAGAILRMDARRYLALGSRCLFWLGTLILVVILLMLAAISTPVQYPPPTPYAIATSMPVFTTSPTTVISCASYIVCDTSGGVTLTTTLPASIPLWTPAPATPSPAILSLTPMIYTISAYGYPVAIAWFAGVVGLLIALLVVVRGAIRRQ